jgi:tetratricopeptide (TPR) repeat protein
MKSEALRRGVLGATCLAAGWSASYLPLAQGADVPAAVKQTPAAEETKPNATPERIAALIEQLGDDDFFARERAQAELARIGFEAFDALSEAENNDDIEIAARAKYLVRSMQVDWIAEADPQEVKALLAEYGAKSVRERSALVKQLADLSEGKGWAALCRIVRFDSSPLVAKEAAVALMTQKAADDEAWQKLSSALQRGIGASIRPGAVWTRNYLRSRTDPAGATEEWGKLAAAEEKLARESPAQSRPDLAAALWRQQVVLLRRLDRRDEAVAAMLKVVAQEQGASDDTLFDLLTWLTEQQAWEIIDEVAKRYAPRIDANPLLLYALAEARAKAGSAAEAEKLADQAAHAKQFAGNQDAHIKIYLLLQQRHLHRWIAHELRQIIAIGPPTSYSTMICQSILADLLHDQGDETAAADLLERALKSIETSAQGGNAQGNQSIEPERLRARFHYYHACRLSAPAEKQQRIEHLKQAMEADPTDADVLIALFREPQLDAELKERTERLIKEAADLFRRQIQENADDPTPYNQLAWLLSNTERDQKEAVECSLKSLELKPNEPGFLDTLGRCYYALGDYANAVKYQTQAVELNPHSGLMTKQLALFREALAKQQAERKP